MQYNVLHCIARAHSNIHLRAVLIGLFLSVHPAGASCDYIWSYLHTQYPHLSALRPAEVQSVLESLQSNAFEQTLIGVGTASVERRWQLRSFLARVAPSSSPSLLSAPHASVAAADSARDSSS